MPRNAKRKIIDNRSEFYRFLREKRGVKTIRHYDTQVLQNPSVAARASLRSTNHIWKYGDRYYNLAYRYYGNSRYWWVIAWYNARPTEANIKIGDSLQIPLNLEEALTVLGSY